MKPKNYPAKPANSGKGISGRKAEPPAKPKIKRVVPVKPFVPQSPKSSEP